MDGLIRRHLLERGRDLLSAFPAVVVQGARQAGKSTFAQMIAAEHDHLTVNLDDDDTRDFALLDPRSFVTQAGAGVLVIDEVQREPGLLLAIKSAIDTDRRPGRFLLTGSSDLLRLSRTPDSLAGRAVTLDLGTLSQGEIAGHRDDFASWVRQSEGRLAGAASPWSRSDYVRAITHGGYPEIQRLAPQHHTTWFDSYIDRLLTRDIRDVSRGLSSDRLSAVLRLVAANQGGELVQARLASDLSMPRSSITAYLSALSILYLTSDLPPWRANLTKREVGRHKVSIADAGLAARLARLRPEGLERLSAAPVLGAQLEALVAAELGKQQGWSEEEFELFHFRDRDGLEVDIVVEYPDGGVFLIEVKATATYRSDHTRGIRALADQLGDRFLGGAVLGLSTERRQLGDRIWGLPISTIWSHGG